MKYNGPEYEDDNDYYNDSNFADNEYLEDYLSSEAIMSTTEELMTMAGHQMM